ncbi:6ffdd4e0-5e2c-480d-ab29-b9adfdac16c1 [Sclerotinia trifoliorum]|uniref:6ffdd4e0-5e2c-480d-ab29-b9adfdac16c1 n=1 Tax=Sclerotinia trifoliorum TaxID=28548 RepID=A0A8H2W3Q5_9HELO|nr:6ffdd4e0-5e2c-480d-ab29-b9adfdac16c1 [Sclerotinia trifoliorum]
MFQALKESMTEKVQTQPKDANGQPSTQEKVLAQINEKIKAAQEASENATEARKKADSLPDSEDAQEQKAKLVEEAQKLEKRAHSELKIAQRLQSGIPQTRTQDAMFYSHLLSRNKKIKPLRWKVEEHIIRNHGLICMYYIIISVFRSYMEL